MGRELAERFPIVHQTFQEAEQVFIQETGESLLELIQGQSNLSPKEQALRLQDTQISQPATLTMDIAIMRLLNEFGIHADMVAGHHWRICRQLERVFSALKMLFEPLLAVAKWLLFIWLILEKWQVLLVMRRAEELIANIDEYVICANKNCPSQTVVAGSSNGIDLLCLSARKEGIRATKLPVSHAFHTKIVAPASVPLKNILNQLTISAPQIPINTNISGQWYPHAREEIIEILSTQLANPVEWTKQMENLYHKILFLL